jgi:peroxiredoxin/uncharacterized membrane protein YphA (DoxX/SURF4 family)
MELVLLLIRLFLFAVFAVAGIGKLLDLEGSEKAVKAFGTPDNYAKFFAFGLPFAEIVFAVCLLFVGTSWIGAIGALILLLSFIGGMISQIRQGNAPDCHCFGAIHSEPVSVKSLVRNIVFALLAVVLIASGKYNQGLSLADLSNEMLLQLIFGFTSLGLLIWAVSYLKKISEQQNQIMRRIEVLEVISNEGAASTRENLANPLEGLPIGAPVPDFVLPNLAGKEVAFEHLLAQAKPILFFFVSANCNPCAALLPEIEIWQDELRNKVNIVFVSSGSAKENAEKFGGTKFKQVLLQKDREVAEFFNAVWTPTAVLVNSDGTLASHSAAGDAAIRELIEKIKSEETVHGTLFISNGNSAFKIGDEVPEFSANDVDGKEFLSKSINGKKTLLTYWSLNCGWCGKMLDDLREWDKTRGLDEPNLLLVSSGDAEMHKQLELSGKILLEEEAAVSKKFGMTGTPSAVLIDEDGRIVSEVAVGAQNIWALIGKRNL